MTVLLVGQRFTLGERALMEAMERAANEVIVVPTVAPAQAALRLKTPRCLLADANEDIRELSRELRSRAECFGVPLIALADVVDERVILELMRCGADDVVASHDLAGLERRVAALSSFDPQARTALFQGVCMLAVPDRDQRQLMGRALRQAGFDVSFAEDTDEALSVAERSPPKVLIVSDRLPPHGGNAALRLLSAHWVGAMPAVLLSSQAEHGAKPTFPSIQEDAPPDDLLFVVNELLRPRELVEARASRRVLYASLCSFRSAGEFEARSGLTYNISREGVYVRTFDAPASPGRVWLELRPPLERDPVHLRGEVAWVRTLTTGARGAAPPGFGVQLRFEESPAEDCARYVRAYEQLADTV